MTVPAATFQNFQSIGTREDLEDMIYNIAPTETPFLSQLRKEKATAVLHEWQTDTLASASASNAAVEGDNPTLTSVVPTVRLGNYAQISQYSFGISGTQMAVNNAGRKQEMAYQLVKYGKTLKRDMEAVLTQNQASSAGNASTARKTGSLEAWLSTNWTSQGSGGSPSSSGFQSGLVQAAVDNSAQGTVTEANVKAIIRACWTAGGNPEMIMTGPFNKTKVSAFSGIATQYNPLGGSAKPGVIIAAADVYVSDFGTHKVYPNRFQRDRTIFVLDMDYWAIAYLRPFQQKDLAITGDSLQKQMLAEYTLVSKQQAASGKITDCTTT